MGIAKIISILLAAEILVFLLGIIAFFLVGLSSGGLQEGLRLTAGVFYFWFAFAALGLIVGTICSTIVLVKGK